MLVTFAGQTLLRKVNQYRHSVTELHDGAHWHREERNALSGTLHGDHSKMSRARRYRLGRPIPLPDRLPHQTCNIQRGDGGNDHLAAAGNGRRADQGLDTTKLSMPWPW